MGYMDISKYTAYFHDGILIDIQHVGNDIEISMISSEIVPEDMIENMPPLKTGSIMGKLHLEEVKKIQIDDEIFSGILKKTHDDGGIFDFQILGHKVTLTIIWKDFFSDIDEQFSDIEIEAAKIDWENMPNFSKDMSKYTVYFQGGNLMNFGHSRDDNDISRHAMDISMESAEIAPENMPHLNKKRITAMLFLFFIREIKINQEIFSGTLEKAYDSGKILKFEIVDDTVTLGIEWRNDPPKPSTSDYSLIEIEADNIYWATLPNFSFD